MALLAFHAVQRTTSPLQSLDEAVVTAEPVAVILITVLTAIITVTIGVPIALPPDTVLTANTARIATKLGDSVPQ